ncbi:AAA family ATPase [Streptomyces sp. A3M-1-3]|uniref:AAA family ATPase n=1 Tax=Streptomyces sp. A3M-1-3 TaxID=2962044 RepID=UPI0020B8B3DC|nr:AAA family ATPase [Streptomyces sp. A3M-1-3]MCP3818789.1 AAA family ATPase [Streptomyces sp. A3M-1-3]
MRDPVERVQWSVAERVLQIVVLDWGLWTREERDHYHSRARSLGARVVLCVVDPPLDELRRRLAGRNADLPSGTFHITDAGLDDALSYFERPTPAELATYDGDTY